MPNSIALKIRSKLLKSPEMKMELHSSLDRLCRFLKLSEEKTRNLFLLAGFDNDKYRCLSIVTDEDEYDILETYELKTRLLLTRSWDDAWKSIEYELTNEMPIYGTAKTETILKLEKAFKAIRKSVEGKDDVWLDFAYFAKDEHGQLIYLD